MIRLGNNIIHYRREVAGVVLYDCTRRFRANPKKITLNKKKVTCKRCLRIINAKPKKPPIMHYLRNIGGEIFYLCKPLEANPNNSTTDKKKVTCQTCLNVLNKK